MYLKDLRRYAYPRAKTYESLKIVLNEVSSESVLEMERQLAKKTLLLRKEVSLFKKIWNRIPLIPFLKAFITDQENNQKFQYKHITYVLIFGFIFG